eukprot:960474-Amphidinium_carterae.1
MFRSRPVLHYAPRARKITLDLMSHIGIGSLVLDDGPSSPSDQECHPMAQWPIQRGAITGSQNTKQLTLAVYYTSCAHSVHPAKLDNTK